MKEFSVAKIRIFLYIKSNYSTKPTKKGKDYAIKRVAFLGNAPRND